MSGPPAEWWSDRRWFFNPLSWQLLFFTGFAFASGWLPPPPADRRLTIGAIAFVVACVPVTFWWLIQHYAVLHAAFEALAPWTDKTYFGPLRYLHFLALAYLALRVVDAQPRLLTGPVSAHIIKVGQQALPVFLSSILLAQAVGIVLDLVRANPAQHGGRQSRRHGSPDRDRAPRELREVAALAPAGCRGCYGASSSTWGPSGVGGTSVAVSRMPSTLPASARRLGARSPRSATATSSRPSQEAIRRSSAASAAAAVAWSMPGSAWEASTERRLIARSARRSTLATSRSPRRNGRT